MIVTVDPVVVPFKGAKLLNGQYPLGLLALPVSRVVMLAATWAGVSAVFQTLRSRTWPLKSASAAQLLLPT